MPASIHVLDRSAGDVRTALIDTAVGWGLTAREHNHADRTKPLWNLRILQSEGRWVAIINLPARHRELTEAIASRLQTFVLNITVNDPYFWAFSAFSGNEMVGSYRWELPESNDPSGKTDLEKFEHGKLAELGVTGLETLKSRLKSRSDRFISSDPKLELHYRSKVSDGKLDLPKPVVKPELPRLIHKITGFSTAARIRNILSKPHLYVAGAAGEFGRALGLPEWMNPLGFPEQGSGAVYSDGSSILMIEKK